MISPPTASELFRMQSVKLILHRACISWPALEISTRNNLRRVFCCFPEHQWNSNRRFRRFRSFEASTKLLRPINSPLPTFFPSESSSPPSIITPTALTTLTTRTILYNIDLCRCEAESIHLREPAQVTNNTLQSPLPQQQASNL